MSTESRVNVGGASLRVLVDGKEGTPWVVMSHSIMADSHIFDEQAAALRDKFRVLRIDTRGHGGSEASAAPYDMALLVGDVIKVLDHFGIAKAHFLGLSLGGMIGYGLGLLYPDRLASLVIASSRADMPGAFGAVWDDRIALVREGGMKALATPTVERWFSVDFLAANPAVREQMTSAIVKVAPQGFEGCARALQGLNYSPEIGRIKTPTLLIAGSRDASIPEDLRAIHGQIAGSEYAVIEGSGHIPTVDNAAEFNRIAVPFLARVAALNC